MAETLGGYNQDVANATSGLKQVTITEDTGSKNKVFLDIIIYKSDGTTVKYIKQLVTTTTACSGADGAANRVLTLTNTALTEGPVSVIMGNTPLVETVDFTVSHKTASSTITFLNALFNGQTLEVKYYE